MIKVISFDLDGTLADENFDNIVWQNKIPKLYAKDKGLSFERALEEVTGEYTKLWGKTERWRDIAFWFEHFGLRQNWKQLIEELKDKVNIYNDVRPVLEELHKKHKLIIVTHADIKFIKLKLSAGNLEKYFYRIFSVSSHFNKMKKDEEVFKEVMRELAVKASEIIHVGDGHRFDYEVPTSLGIRACLIDRSGKEDGPHVIRSLFELKNKIPN